MPKFVVQNLTGQQQRIAIEPWADVETLDPRDQASFDYDEPATIEFALVEGRTSAVSLWIWTDRITIAGKQGTRIWNMPDAPEPAPADAVQPGGQKT